VGTFVKTSARVSRACDRPPKTRRNSRRQRASVFGPLRCIASSILNRLIRLPRAVRLRNRC
jgi:hypothetical protein